MNPATLEAIEQFKHQILVMQLTHPEMCMTRDDVMNDFFSALEILHPYNEQIPYHTLKQLKIEDWVNSK